MLKDPITGFPVIIVEQSILKGIVSDIILMNIDKILGGDVNELMHNDEFNNTISRFRMIPFSSLGKQNGLLLGIKVDSVKIVMDEKVYTVNNAIIGIYDKSFTKNGAYTAIFGLDMLEGGNQNECFADIKV